MKCQNGFCLNKPQAQYIWGEGRNKQAVLCELHGNEFWQKFKGRIGLGYLPFIIKELTTD